MTKLETLVYLMLRSFESNDKVSAYLYADKIEGQGYIVSPELSEDGKVIGVFLIDNHGRSRHFNTLNGFEERKNEQKKRTKKAIINTRLVELGIAYKLGDLELATMIKRKLPKDYKYTEIFDEDENGKISAVGITVLNGRYRDVANILYSEIPDSFDSTTITSL